jgi:hypothetical protein
MWELTWLPSNAATNCSMKLSAIVSPFKRESMRSATPIRRGVRPTLFLIDCAWDSWLPCAVSCAQPGLRESAMLLPQSSSGDAASCFVFSPDEVARLEIYRDAVRAGFYNDNICHDIDTSIGTQALLSESGSGRQDAADPLPRA